MAGCGHAAPGAAPPPEAEPSPVPETSLFGHVVRAGKAGTDPVPVAGAAVWTVPASDQVHSDSTGAWTINAGLAQRQYRVYASIEDLEGHTSLVAAKINQAVSVVVILGADETAWPPDTLFQRLFPVGNRGPAKVRCCH